MSAASPLRIGVVGCGAVAQRFHLPALARLAGVEVRALAEPDPARLEQAASALPRAERFSDWRPLLETARLDAVLVAAPNALHSEVSTEALRAGVHVYVEKPLATDLTGASALLSPWRASGRVAMVGFNYRYHRLCRRARRSLASGKLGKVLSLRSRFTTAPTAPSALPAWRRSRASGGGVLLDLASHEIDMARWLLGDEIERVHAEMRSVRDEHDTASLRLRMVGGAHVDILVSSCATDDAGLEVHGELGQLSLDRYGSWTVRQRGLASPGLMARTLSTLGSAAGLPWRLQRARSPGGEPSFSAALAAFVAAVRGEADDTMPTPEDGWRSLAVVEAAERSAISCRAETPESPP